MGLSTKYLDVEYVQPKLDPTKREERFRLLFASEIAQSSLSRAEAIDLVTWVYTELYSEEIFESPKEGAAFVAHTHA